MPVYTTVQEIDMRRFQPVILAGGALALAGYLMLDLRAQSGSVKQYEPNQ